MTQTPSAQVGEIVAEEPFGGLRVITSNLLMIGPFEDWSQVRSHGRAARRRKLGHPQRIRIYYKPNPNAMKLPDGSLVMHPATYQRLRAHLAKDRS